MKLIKIITLAATLAVGVSAVNASPYDVMGGLKSLTSVSEAYNATVLKVDNSDGSFLKFDNDVASLQARIKGNGALVRNIEAQGYAIDQIVGVSGSDTDLTLYAL